jgi:hypothetical protein
METINKGTILVSTKPQSTGCGITYLKQGSIVKCAEDSLPFQSSVKIYRNENEMALNSWKPVSRNKLRIATDDESLLYYSGKHFLEEVKI